MADLITTLRNLIGPENAWTGILWMVLFSGLFVLACLLVRNNQAPARRYWFSIINSLLLTVFTVGFAAEQPFLLSVQAEVMNTLHPFEGFIHQNQSLEKVMGNNRLWLVDVSHDVSLASDSAMTPTWDSRQVITDRRKLTHLFRSLASDSIRDQVDLVVCDLTFGSASDPSQDLQLRQAITQLNSLGKLLIAQSQLADNREVGGTAVVDADTLAGGLVDIMTYFDRQFYAYPLFSVTDPVKRRPSLAYAIYRRLRNIRADTTAGAQAAEIDEKGNRWLIMRQFIPDYLVDDTDVAATTDPASVSLSEVTGRLVPYFYRLGQLTELCVEGDSLSREYDPKALLSLTGPLAKSHGNGLRNVVFVGIFDGNERDMHQTAIGPMHGSMILVNALLNLLNGAHRITWWYVVLLLVGFAVISWQFLHVEIGKRQGNTKSKPPKKPKPHESISQKMGRMARKAGETIGNWLLDNQIYLLTLTLLLTAIVLSNHMINIAVVEFYLGINAFLFREFWLSEPATPNAPT